MYCNTIIPSQSAFHFFFNEIPGISPKIRFLDLFTVKFYLDSIFSSKVSEYGATSFPKNG